MSFGVFRSSFFFVFMKKIDNFLFKFVKKVDNKKDRE